ncbi:MAG TPA: hypothetical protein ENK33_04475 [Desulfobacterales bacterium]|nr:hypothetical protein [Desulfobacterales bacterium]
MKEEIKNLIELQTIDLEVYKINEEMRDGLSSLDTRRQGIEDDKKTISDYQEQLESGGKRRRELEVMISDEEERIKDRQSKIMNIQTNREYQSILKEIEDTKLANKQREDELLLLIEQLEALEKKIEEIKNKCAAEEEKIKKDSTAIEHKASKLEKKKKAIMKARDAQAAKVNKKYLKRYETLKERRSGLAVAGVAAGVCLGCNMNIPPQMFNELLREDEILSCPTCNRMMYHQPAESTEE